MSSYTKGPWVAVNYGGFLNLQQYNEYSEKDNLLDEDRCPDAEANAKLAAAAPELIEALQKAIEIITETDWDVCGYSLEQINEWKILINKATT